MSEKKICGCQPGLLCDKARWVTRMGYVCAGPWKYQAVLAFMKTLVLRQHKLQGEKGTK